MIYCICIKVLGGVAGLLLEYLKTYKAQIFSRGQSAKVFREVHDKNGAICVIKNSEPYVAILPHSLYLEILGKANQKSKDTKESEL